MAGRLTIKTSPIMNKEKEEMTRNFWEQFPKGTEQHATAVEKYILQTMWEMGMEKIPLLESLCAIGIGVGKLLQIFCQQQGYVGEEKMKAILCNSLKMSFDYYKENHSSEINDRLGQTYIGVFVVKSLMEQ